MLSCLAYVRYYGDSKLMVIANRNEHEIDYYLPEDWHNATALYGNFVEENKVKVEGLGVAILKK
jgi:hypothetical protein